MICKYHSQINYPDIMNYPSYFPPLSSHRSPMKRSTKIPRLNHLRRLGGIQIIKSPTVFKILGRAQRANRARGKSAARVPDPQGSGSVGSAAIAIGIAPRENAWRKPRWGDPKNKISNRIQDILGKTKDCWRLSPQG